MPIRTLECFFLTRPATDPFLPNYSAACHFKYYFYNMIMNCFVYYKGNANQSMYELECMNKWTNGWKGLSSRRGKIGPVKSYFRNV